MIPILYKQSETAFADNGICRLVDCVSCEVTEERNGIYELEFVYPITGRGYDQIKEGLIVAATHDNTGEIEPFDIYARSAPIDGLVTFYASHISYRLSNYILKPFSANGIEATMARIRESSLSYCPFTFWTDKTTEGGYNLANPKSIKDMLGGSEGSVLDVFGTGEYEFNKFDVKLWLHRGEDRGVQIRYGKNLLDITDEQDYGEVYNAIIPYWASSESGELVTLPEWFISVPGLYSFIDTWTDENGVDITDENGNVFEFGYVPLAVRMEDLSSDFQFKPTPAQLREYAISKFSKSGAWVMNRTIDIDFVQLWQTDDYKDIAPLEEVGLCDTVTVIFPELGVDTQKKVVSVTYDVLSEKYTQMELGDPRSSFTTLISDIVHEEIDPVTQTELSNAVSNVASAITGNQGGNVVLMMEGGKPRELLIMDTDDIQTARNVWRWNLAGLGHSSNGYNGNYDDLALLANGMINASRILTGYMSANRIRAGQITAESSESYWNLDTGKFLNTGSPEGMSTQTFISNGTISGKIKIRNVDSYSIWPTYVNLGGETNYGGSIFTQEAFLTIGFKEDGATSVTPAIRIWNESMMSDTSYAVSPITMRQRVSFLHGAALHNIWPLEVIGKAQPNDSSEVTLGTFGDIQQVNGWRVPLIMGREGGFGISCGYYSNPYLAMLVNNSCYSGSNDKVGDISIQRYLVIGRLGAAISRSTYSSVKLEVEGQAFVSGGVVQSSDERKKDVREWDSRYDELFDRLEPIMFTWRDYETDKTHIGVSAQRTERALNELGIDGIVYGTGEEDKPYSVAYHEIAMLAVKRVHDLEKRLEEAERKIEELCRYISSQH